ncbi:PAS domain S-box protein [bacterium]|nr:PAS domain S-box protein [bacterium]
MMCKQMTGKIVPIKIMSKTIAVRKSSGTVIEISQDISESLVKIWGFDRSWIGMINEEANTIEGVAGFGFKASEMKTCYSITADSQNPACLAYMQKKGVINQPIADRPKTFDLWLKKLGIQSYGYFPILKGRKVFGVVGAFYHTNRVLKKGDAEILFSALEQTAVALENAQLHEKIKLSEKRYHALFESMNIGLAVIDHEQRICSVNQTFENLSGYSREALIDKMTLNQFLSGESQKRNEMIRGMNQSPQFWECHFVNKKGLVKHVHMTVTRMANSSNRLVSLIDISKQKELERRVNRSEELASIGELSAGIAHEIRNPLVAITTSVNLLKDEPQLSDEGQQLLDIVKEESDHLAVIVDDFLKYTRPKKPSFQKENINSLLRDVVQKLKDCNSRKANWMEHYDDDLPELLIDRYQIRQVITNLLLNGLDAIQDGGVLAIHSQKVKHGGMYQVLILISDSGIGIPKEELPKIFQPFYSTKEKGTGMGLAICKRIISEHDGEIHVESKPGKRTTFSVILPIQKSNRKE